jgi:hypothetical protein
MESDDSKDFLLAARRWAATQERSPPRIERVTKDQVTQHDGEGSQRLIADSSLQARAEAAEQRCRELEQTLEKYAQHGSALEVGEPCEARIPFDAITL